MTIKQGLEDVPVDPAAEERAWSVVRAAYRDRVPSPRAARRRGPLVAAAVAVAVVAALLSPPGRAVVHAVRRSIGVSHAAPALFRLPAPGRLLVSGPGGAWVVAADGSKRRLGSYPQASWSPHGLFVVAATRDGLAAIEPGSGDVHWSLARPGISVPRWGGTIRDTRVAYLSGDVLRVVGGDGRGDVAVSTRVRVAPAWKPESHVLAYATASGVSVVDVDTRRLVARHAAPGARELAWSPDGRTLATVVRGGVLLWHGSARHVLRVHGVRAVAFSPDGALALLRRRDVLVRSGDGGLVTLFRSRGVLDGVVWSPDGRRVLTTIPAADQLVILGGPGVRAVDHLARQFGGAVSLDGWMRGT